jgi:hypothetical protein
VASKDEPKNERAKKVVKKALKDSDSGFRACTSSTHQFVLSLFVSETQDKANR